jgi:hypothetical protein
VLSAAHACEQRKSPASRARIERFIIASLCL